MDHCKLAHGNIDHEWQSVQRLPEHPLCAAAKIWLLQSHPSCKQWNHRSWPCLQVALGEATICTFTGDSRSKEQPCSYDALISQQHQRKASRSDFSDPSDLAYCAEAASGVEGRCHLGVISLTHLIRHEDGMRSEEQFVQGLCAGPADPREGRPACLCKARECSEHKGSKGVSYWVR